MNKVLIALVIVIVLGALGYFLLKEPAVTAPVVVTNTYSSEIYKLQFTYPDYYRVDEREVGNAERGHYSLVLVDSRLPEPPEGGEGPTTINVDIYQNNLDQQTTEDWVKNTNDSNYKLSPDGALESFTFAGEAALSYMWDGLYRGETVAVAKGDYIYAFSVTSLTPEDQIRRDFYSILETVNFN